MADLFCVLSHRRWQWVSSRNVTVIVCCFISAEAWPPGLGVSTGDGGVSTGHTMASAAQERVTWVWRSQGRRLPEAENLSTFGCPTPAANSPHSRSESDMGLFLLNQSNRIHELMYAIQANPIWMITSYIQLSRVHKYLVLNRELVNYILLTILMLTFNLVETVKVKRS